ncbi:MAG: SMC-Scp complex subunit ScpB [Candidatus Diapherotrites archaeon CG11_big_fil_rev_8_21_14_0_20_37_9]|nr:MAG: SMC-Scp complex subunit ScpB [Candidatus Diapherotrites archaeon CG11_big_fil_rev_8_21_14_0_20_37_9]
MEKRTAKKLIEAALFMSPGVVSLRDIAKTINSNVAEVRVIVNELTHDYEARDTAIEIRYEQDGARMAVKEEFEGDVSHMAAAPELHKGIMKTLAYIAYKQPVKQSDVIHFRNSKAYEHIKMLKERGFIRKEKKGISYTIYTTPKFKEYFGTNLKKQDNSLEEKDSE